MKLKRTNRDGEEEFMEVDYLSFMKCVILSYMGFNAMCALIILSIAFLVGIYS